MNYNYDKLGTDEKECYNAFVKAAKNFQNIVVFPKKYSMDDVYRIFVAVAYDCPGLFYVNFSNIRIFHTSSNTELEINYLYNVSDIPDMKKRVNDSLRSMLKEIGIKDTDIDIVKFKKIHDYMVKNVVYDHAAVGNGKKYFEAHTIAGVFYRKRAVCEGVAKAFKFLCDRLKIDSAVIIGDSLMSSDKGNSGHAWNAVRIDGEYFHMDITWDMCMSGQCRVNRYDYFLIPDEWINSDHKSTWPGRCSSIANSYFYKTGKYIENMAHLEKYLKDRLFVQKKNIIYFRYKDKCDEQTVKSINDMITKNIRLLGKAGTFYFVNNINQNVFFVKFCEAK